MTTSLSEIRFTEREIRIIRETADDIRREARREKPRLIRICNLSDRVSVTIGRAERRSAKMKKSGAQQ